MYQIKNLDEARKWVRPLTAEPGEASEWAKIRMGDIEFLSRNLNEATQLYGDVQDRSKHTKTPAEIAAAERAKAAEAESGKGKKRGKGAKDPVHIPAPPARVAPWKLSAIRDVAAAENVRNLLDQGFLWEAMQALRAWEREFPLSKISSDYLLLEGRLCVALGDYARCRALLEAYCEQVDASNFVDDALTMILDCMKQMNDSPDAVAKYRAAVKKRMEFR
jgi:TolA-binding protein